MLFRSGDRGDALGARGVEDRVLEVVAAAAASRQTKVERCRRSEDAEVDVRVPDVGDVDPEGGLVDHVVRGDSVDVNRAFEDVGRAGDRVAAVGRVVDVELGAVGACREVGRHVTIGVDVVDGAVAVVVDVVVAEVFAVLAIAGRTRAGVAGFDRAKGGATIEVVGVAVVALFTHVDDAVAAGQDADAGGAVALVTGFDAATHVATVAVGAVAVVAGFTGVTAAIAAAELAHAGGAGAFVAGFDGAGCRATVTCGATAVVARFAGILAAIAAAQATRAGRTRAFVAGFDAADRGAAVAGGGVSVVAGFGAGDAIVAAHVGDADAHAADVARAVGIDGADEAVGAFRTGGAAAVDVGFVAVFDGVVTCGRGTSVRDAHAAGAIRTGQTFDAEACAVALGARAAVGTRRAGDGIRVCRDSRTGTFAGVDGARIRVVIDVVGLVDELGAADAVALFFLTIASRLVRRDRSDSRMVCLAGTGVTGEDGTFGRRSALRVRGTSNTHARIVAVQGAVRSARRVFGLGRMNWGTSVAGVIGAITAVIGQVGVLGIGLRFSGTIADEDLAITRSLIQQGRAIRDVHRATLACIAGAQDAFGARIGAIRLGRTFSHRAARARRRRRRAAAAAFSDFASIDLCCEFTPGRRHECQHRDTQPRCGSTAFRSYSHDSPFDK